MSGRGRGLLVAGLLLVDSSLVACSGRGGDEAGGSGGASGSGGSRASPLDGGGLPDGWVPPDGGGTPEGGGPPADAGPPVCGPEGGGPYWLTEGDNLTFTPTCETGHVLPPEAFVVEGGPAGLALDPAEGRFSFSPGLDQAGVYEVRLRVPSLGETGIVKIGVADRWDATGNVPVDPVTYTEELGLPVFHLFTPDALNQDEHTPARIIYKGREYLGTEAKYRGQTSFGFPKKSFTLKFSKDDRLSDEPRGFVEERRVVLTTTFDDNSHLRQRLAYTLWNRLDPAHIQLAVFNVVLFKNGEYQGIYAATDHVDEDLMEDHGLWENGNLYKARSHSANFRLVLPTGAPKSVLWAGYTKEEGEDLDGDAGEPSYADLTDLIRWVATSPDDEFFEGLGQRVQQNEFEDWWIFVGLIQANDSAGKNAYLYHDPRPDSPAPLFRYVPWDFNACLGQDWETKRVAHDVNPETYQRWNGLFERMLRDERIRGPMLARFDALLHEELDAAVVLSMVDAWAEEIRGAAARDARKWDAAYRAHGWNGRTDFTTHEEEIAYLKASIANRWSYVDGLY